MILRYKFVILFLAPVCSEFKVTDESTHSRLTVDALGIDYIWKVAVTRAL